MTSASGQPTTGPVSRSIYQAIIDESVAATGATCGLLLAQHGGELVVVAMSGPTDPACSIGSMLAAHGARGFALGADQPTALMPAEGDATNRGIGGWQGTPPSLVVAGSGGAVVELAAKQPLGSGFTFEDIELVGAFANIAAAAVHDSGDAVEAPTAPSDLAAELTALARADARRYREVALVLDALLASER